jgi:Transcriptional regulatory protein, C terminal
MPSTAHNSGPRLYRFGAFEADARTGELRKQGRRLAIQDQPVQVLLMLLKQPGALVTRAEIQKSLWPDGTFVDFDHGLNTAINKIREALGDSAANPHICRNPGQARLPLHRPSRSSRQRSARAAGRAAIAAGPTGAGRWRSSGPGKLRPRLRPKSPDAPRRNSARAPRNCSRAPASPPNNVLGLLR